jgi:formate dehydrogenase
MFIRQLNYLAALARECRFGRAVESCSVSQPALSAAIRNMEDELGFAIVQRRGRSFEGAVEKELNLTHHTSLESLTKVCDVVTLNCPPHPETEHTINADSLKNFKRGAYLINTACRKLCDANAVPAALESGQLAGDAGDVWFPQPLPKDHPWRSMPHHRMMPHISGTSLSAQSRYAAGTREILEYYFENRPIRNDYLIVQNGKLAGVGAHSCSAGNATGGSEEAATFKK